MKLAKRIIIGIVVLVVLAWAGLYLAVKVALPPEKVMNLISEQGSAALGREVKVGGASIGVFPTIKIVIKDVELANAPSFSPDPAFKLGRIVLAIDVVSLFRLSPVIKEIRLEQANVLYEVDKKGATNLDGLGGEPSVEEEPEQSQEPLQLPAALSLNSFVIDNASIRYRDLKSGTILTLGSINQKASVSIDKNLEHIATKGELVISSLSISDKQSGVRKGGVRVSLGHDVEINLPEQILTINGIALGLQDVLVEMMGSVKDFQTATPGLDLKLSSNDINIASLLQEVPANLSPEIPKLSAQGFARLKASVVGLVDTAALPSIQASLTLHDIGLGHKDLPAGINDLNGKVHYTENSVEVKDFGFSMDKHPVSVAMVLTNLVDIPHLEKLNIEGKLELGPLTQLLEKFGALPEGLSADGKVVTQLSAKGKLDPENPMGIKAKGSVKLKKVTLRTPALPEKIALNGTMDIDNQTIANQLDVRIGESDVQIKANVSNYLAMILPELAKSKTTKIRGKLVSGMLDLDRLLPAGSEEEEETEETAPLTAYPALPPIDMELQIKLNKTKLMDLEMTDYQQTITIKDEVVNSTLAGKLYTGTFSQTLKVNLKDTTNAKIKTKLKVKSVEADDFISRLNDKIPGTNPILKTLAGTDHSIFGKLNMDMDLKTNGLPQDFTNNLSGDILVALFNGKLVGVNLVQGLNDAISQVQEKVKVGKTIDLGEFSFDKMDLDLEAKNGKLIVKKCEVQRSPAGKLALTGKVGFDTKLKLNLENRLSNKLSKPILAGQKKLQGAAAGAAGKIAGVGKAAGAIAGKFALVPQDKKGRAIAYYNIKGTLAKPTFSVDFKRMKQEASGDAKDAAKDLVDQKKEELKAKAKAEMDKAKAKLEEEKKKAQETIAKEKKKVEDQLEKEKKAAEEKAKKEAEKQKKELKEKAKKKLKGLGF